MIAKELRFIRPTRQLRELQIMSEIEQNERISQRGLAKKTLVTSTMINNYITEMVSNGLLEVEGDTNRSFRYQLTDIGRSRKRELFFMASREIVQFYGLIKHEFRKRIEALMAEGIKRVVLFGGAETGELVCIAARETALQVLCAVDNDPAKWGRKLADVEIRNPKVIREIKPDAVLVTSFGYAEEIFENIKSLENEGIKVRKF